MVGWPWRNEQVAGDPRRWSALALLGIGLEQAHDYAAGKDPMERRERAEGQCSVKSIDEVDGGI